MKSVISETRLREIVAEELENYAIREGLWDDVKGGVEKLSAYVTKHFKSVAGGWLDVISEKLSGMQEIPDEAKQIFGVLKQAMSESGESLILDDTLKLAQKIGKLGSDGALQVVQADLEGPVKNLAASVNESYFADVYLVLSECPNSVEPLNEDFGVTAAVGLGLAMMGGLPMLFKGLSKLAKVLKAEKAAELFQHCEHITHAFEQKTIDKLMPDKLAYLVYVGLWKRGIRLSKGKEVLNELEFKSDEGKLAMKKCKGLIYKILLLYFAFNGITGALKAGVSLLGFVEGAATGVKGVELAAGAAELANVLRSTARAAAT